MPNELHVLMVEDSPDDASFIVRKLRLGGFSVVFERVDSRVAMQSALAARAWDLILSDYAVPQFEGPAALALYHESGLDTPFILVSGAIGEEHAVEMLKAGAHNYVLKDKLDGLVPVVNQELLAAQVRRIRRETERATACLAPLVTDGDAAIIGTTLSGTVLTWNVGAERLYGYAPREILGRSISLVIPPYRPDHLCEILANTSNGHPAQTLETVHLRKDGGPVEVSVTVSPIRDGRGRLIGVSTVAQDLTQSKLDERQRLALTQSLTAAQDPRVKAVFRAKP